MSKQGKPFDLESEVAKMAAQHRADMEHAAIHLPTIFSGRLVDNGDGTITRPGLPAAALQAMRPRNLATTEAGIMRQIMVGLSADGHAVFRANVGLFFTKDGRPARTGLPVGFSDLFGFRLGDARAFFMEVKTATGRPSDRQLSFLQSMAGRGAITGIVRSVDEARQLLREPLR